MPNLININGQRFGTFTVCGRAPGPAGAKSAWWMAACDCGAELPIRGDSLKAGTRCPKCTGGAQGRRNAHHSFHEAIEANSEFVTECGCQIWTGSVDGAGYGQIRVEGRREGAHRASWMKSRGAIPDGLWVLHHCDTPPCINPDHLFLGTQSDNVADYWAKRRRIAWLKKHYA